MLKKDWELHHLCLVVRDWNRAIDYYQNTRMGVNVGPQVMGLDYRHGGPVDSYFNKDIPRTRGGLGPGKPLKESKRGRRDNFYKYMDKDVQVGDLLLEIGEDMGIPLDGITHICFNVPNINEETEILLDKGCAEMMHFIQGDVILENHIDTREYGNIDISFRPPVLEKEKAWIEHVRSHPTLKEWKFHGIGMVVRDLDKTVEYWQMLDIIDIQSEIELDSSNFDPINVSSEPPESNFKARKRVGQVGPVAFEFIELLEGNSIYHESMESRGEGVAEMAFTVADLEEETATMIYRGVPAILSGKPKNGPAFACFDTRKESGNIVIRLIQRD